MEEILAMLQSYDLGLLIGIAAAALLGIIGWVVAGVALRRGKKAVRAAYAVTDVANEAVRTARQAQEVADRAHELGTNALAAAEQQERRMTESSHVEWQVSCDEDRRGILVSNAGSDAAFDVRFVVDRDGRRELSTGLEHVPRDGQLLLPFPELVDQSVQLAYAGDSASARHPRTGALNVVGTVATATVDIRWSSKLGTLQRETFTLEMR